jgi:putative transposase
LATRKQIAKNFMDTGHSKSKVLKFSKIPRSTWYDSLKKGRAASSSVKGRPIPGFTVNRDGLIVPDSVTVNILKTYRAKPEFWAGGGYQKLKHYLRRDFGFYINGKKIYRLCKENNLLLPRRYKKKRRFRRICLNRTVTGPNQLWEFDIKYGHVHGENKFFFILAFVDVFTRKVIDYHCGKTCKALDLKFTLLEALRKERIDHTSGLVIRSDNGTQMTSYMFQKHIEENGVVEHEFIPPATPNKNAHVESFFSILDREFIEPRFFDTFQDAYKQTMEFIEIYNNFRIHGSLKMMSPVEFTEQFLQENIKIQEVTV